MFKKTNSNRAEVKIVSEAGNVYYMPSSLTITETEEIIYALYGEHVNWDKTAQRNFSTDELTYALRRYVNQNPEKMLTEALNPNVLRAYAEESFQNALWYDIEDAKEF